MKKRGYSMAMTFMVLACIQATTPGGDKNARVKSDTITERKGSPSQSSISDENLLTLSDAESILGEPAHLSDSASTVNDSALKHRRSYTANAKDSQSGKIGNIYFMLEKYDQVSGAQKRYSDVKTSNQNSGIEALHDVGDEAYFHTDGQNFYFIIIRKGTDVFNMKVNKITRKTSLDKFNRVARKIAGQ